MAQYKEMLHVLKFVLEMKHMSVSGTRVSDKQVSL